MSASDHTTATNEQTSKGGNPNLKTREIKAKN
jgi:hypothetical protein